MRRTLDDLANRLEHRFRDPDLLEAALTHRSAGSRNNERLEFLGDAVLGFVIAEWLYQEYTGVSEGQLSRLRASLVKGETLAGIARQLEIGNYLRLGAGELKSGGFRRDSILADAVEAVLGAVYLDAGFQTCRVLIQKLFADRFDNLSLIDEHKDPKTRLQEYLQSKKFTLPVYEVVDVSGKAHHQRFVVECRVEVAGEHGTRGEGSSRRRAEQCAAQSMLAELSANE